MGSLHFKPLHGLEQISFPAIPGKKGFHDNTPFLFLDLINTFVASLHLKPLLISIVNKCYHGNSLCGFFVLQMPVPIGAD